MKKDQTFHLNEKMKSKKSLLSASLESDFEFDEESDNNQNLISLKSEYDNYADESTHCIGTQIDHCIGDESTHCVGGTQIDHCVGDESTHISIEGNDEYANDQHYLDYEDQENSISLVDKSHGYHGSDVQRPEKMTRYSENDEDQVRSEQESPRTFLSSLIKDWVEIQSDFDQVLTDHDSFCKKVSNESLIKI